MGVPKPTDYLADVKVQASRGVAQPAGYQAGTRTSVNGVRGYEPLKESPRSDVNINVLIDNLSLWLSTRSDRNQAVHAQTVARGLKIRFRDLGYYTSSAEEMRCVLGDI